MNNIKLLPAYALVFSSFLFIVSCTLERNIIGTWQIESYSAVSVDGSSANAKNIGSRILKKRKGSQ